MTPAAHGLGPTRARVLALLQDAGEPLTVATAGARLGMHANTARFHLDALADAGLADRHREERTTRGRPKVLYAAGADAPAAQHRSYRLLAEILSTLVTDHLSDPAGSAEEAGRAWGRGLSGPEPPSSPVPAQRDAVDDLVGAMDRAGFDSHVVEGDDALRVDVSHCPFLEVAADHHDVVCSVHLGMMRGILERSGASVAVDSLEPLVEPSLCIAHLRR